MTTRECPQGKKVTYRKTHTAKDGVKKKRYLTRRSDCSGCPIKTQCIGKSHEKRIDITMGNRNDVLQSPSLTLAIIFPLLLIPGFFDNYRKYIAITVLAIALACVAYLSYMYGSDILTNELLTIPLGFILTIALLGSLMWIEMKREKITAHNTK